MTTNEAQNTLLKMRTDLLRAIQLHKDRGLSPGPLQMQADALGAGIMALEDKIQHEAAAAAAASKLQHPHG